MGMSLPNFPDRVDANVVHRRFMKGDAMHTTLPETAAAYIRATNSHDPKAFLDCFDANAIVHDAGRELRGIAAIEAWSAREIMEPLVTLEILDTSELDGDVVITTKVDGNFDRTGLPNPIIIDHQIKLEAGKIVGLQCRLASVDVKS